MSLGTRLEARATKKPEYHSLIQTISEDGSLKPTYEEVEKWKSDVEAEGFEPFLIKLTIRGGRE